LVSKIGYLTCIILSFSVLLSKWAECQKSVQWVSFFFSFLSNQCSGFQSCKFISVSPKANIAANYPALYTCEVEKSTNYIFFVIYKMVG
jgi:hypothetical protein